MRWSPDYPDYPTSDRLVLSEGHAVPIIYAACAQARRAWSARTPRTARKLTMEDAQDAARRRQSSSTATPTRWRASPSSTRRPARWARASRVAAGLGEAARLDDLDKRIYCIIGDGEIARGPDLPRPSTTSSDHKLTNVLPIFNCNELRPGRPGLARSSRPSGSRPSSRRRATTVKVIDGHDPDADQGRLRRSSSQRHAAARQAHGGRRQDRQGLGLPVACRAAAGTASPPTGDALKQALAELDEKRVSSSPARWRADAVRDPAPAGGPAQEHASRRDARASPRR